MTSVTKRILIVMAASAALAVAAGAAWLLWPPSGPAVEPLAGPRPAEWAQPLERPGCPNLHKVSGVLYRGAQPTAGGMKQLEKLGVKTVVNLRSFGSDRDEMKAAGVKFDYEHITMKAWHAEDQEVVRFLKIVADESRTPVFVHCKHGADRTGTMCAIYRIAVQGWSKEEALRELRGGYGYHGVWQNLLRYVQGLDVAGIKRSAGLDG